MSRMPVTPAGSGSIADKFQLAVDLEAEPVDWDHAIARFLLAVVRKESLPANVVPLATLPDDSLGITAGLPVLSSPTN